MSRAWARCDEAKSGSEERWDSGWVRARTGVGHVK